MVAEVGGVAAGIVGGVVEGYFYDKKIDKLSDAVDHIMENAHQKAHALMQEGFTGLTVQQIEFFNHVDLTLNGFKNIYEGQMHLTVDKVDKKAQGILATLDKVVYSCTKDLMSPQMQQLAYEAKAVFNSLPFVDSRPKLTAFSPVFVAPTNNPSNILIKCWGNFPALPNSKARPILQFNEKEYPSIHNQPEIAFSIPMQDLFPLGANSANGIRSASFNVKIPYEDSWFWSTVWPTQTYYDYQGSIYLLPESPGKITIYYTRLREVVEKEEIVSDEYIQSSRGKVFMPTSLTLTKPYTLHAKPGWKIIPESVQFQVIVSKGDKENVDTLKNKWELHSVTPEQATYLVTTHHYFPTAHCGKIKFKISATQSRSHFVQETIKEEVVLKWGESKIIDESKGSWKIHFDSFEGVHNELPGYGSTRFLKVQSFGGNPVLTVETPERVTSHFLLSSDPIAAG